MFEVPVLTDNTETGTSKTRLKSYDFGHQRKYIR